MSHLRNGPSLVQTASGYVANMTKYFEKDSERIKNVARQGGNGIYGAHMEDVHDYNSLLGLLKVTF